VQGSAEVDRPMGAKRLVASVKVELSCAEDEEDAESVESGDMINEGTGKQRLQQLRKKSTSEHLQTLFALPNGCSLQLPPATSAAFAENLVGGVTTSLSIGPLMACALHNVRVSVSSFQLPDETAAMAPASLRVAAAQAVNHALHAARHLQDGQISDLVLLEPLMRVVVNAPQSVVGAVVSDIGSRRRGIVVEVATCDSYSPNVEKGSVESQVIANIPLVHLIGYASSLRSMTGGCASFSASFLRYSVVADEDAAPVLGTE
jgi:translation elongation factor EF-G